VLSLRDTGPSEGVVSTKLLSLSGHGVRWRASFLPSFCPCGTRVSSVGIVPAELLSLRDTGFVGGRRFYRAVVPAGHGFRRRASFLPRFCPYRDMGFVGGHRSCRGVVPICTRAFGERVGNRHDGKKAPQGLKLGRNACAGSPNVPQGRKIGR
jgi:hypothetical protein